MSWLTRRWSWWVLAGVVAASMGLAAYWVFLVPIYQSPDEPQHLDYALCLAEHGRLFQATDSSWAKRPGGYENYYKNFYLCYFLHPYTSYLLEQSEHASIWGNNEARVPPGYGTRAYFQALDRGAPKLGGLRPPLTPPSLAFAYPFGYYGLLALWIGMIRTGTDSLTVLFFGARLLSVLLLGCGLVLSYATLREMRCRRGWSLLLTACIGLFPMTSFVASYVQPDNLSFALSTLGTYLAFRVRRRPEHKTGLTLLGLALGALLITKQHYFVCLAVPVAALVFVEHCRRRYFWRHRLVAGLLLAVPSLVLGSIHAWTVWGTNHQPLPRVPHAHAPAHLLPGMAKAVQNFYGGLTHRCFWGLFGWVDAPLVIGTEAADAVARILLHVVSLGLLGLTLLRLEQVCSRLFSLARAGRPGLAVRLAVSNPAANSYFLFTALMVYLFARTDNFFGAQGRNWFPYLLPIFWTGLAYAPRALSLRPTRRAVTATLTGALALYVAVGSVYSVRAIEKRYYHPGGDRPMREVTVPREPAAMHQLHWKDGVADVYGNQSWLIFKLPRPEHLRCVRLRYRVDCPDRPFALLHVYWRQAGRNEFVWQERMAQRRLRMGPESNWVTLWVDDTVDEIRIDPDEGPCRFELLELKAYGDPPG